MNKINFISPIVHNAKYGVLPKDLVIKDMVIFDFVIIYMKQGKVEVVTQGKKYIVQPGDIFFLRPKIKLAVKSISSNEIHMKYVHFNLFHSHDNQSVHLKNFEDLRSEEWTRFQEDIIEDYPYIPEHIRLPDPIAFENKIVDIIHEFEQKITLYELEVKAKVTMLLVYLWRELYWDQNNVDPNYEIVLKVKEYLNANYMNNVTLDDLIDITFISKFHLIHLFKKTFGTTPIQYHQNVRIKKSKELIRHTNYSLSEIAGKLGFDSIHSFSRYFKKIDGNPPSYYRKKYKA